MNKTHKQTSAQTNKQTNKQAKDKQAMSPVFFLVRCNGWSHCVWPNETNKKKNNKQAITWTNTKSWTLHLETGLAPKETTKTNKYIWAGTSSCPIIYMESPELSHEEDAVAELWRTHGSIRYGWRSRTAIARIYSTCFQSTEGGK